MVPIYYDKKINEGAPFMNISLDYYKIFYYAAKYGQITLAAKELSLSQPAVSQAIKQLETQLDTRLFTRTPKGIILTVEGKLLFEYVKSGYESILLGEQQLSQMKKLDTGEIHIGASDMTLRFYLLPFLEVFHQRYPGIKVSVTNAPTPETLDFLNENRIDFGVVSTPLPEDCNAQIRPAKEIRDVFVAGNHFRELKNRTVSPSALEDLPLICLEKNTSTRHSLDTWMESCHIHVNPEFELATSDMIVQFAIRNLGVGYVMEGFAEEYIHSNILFPLKLSAPLPVRQFCIVTKKGRRISDAAARLLELLD